MGTDIKTRKVRRDIKVLDKPAIAAERIRQSHVRIREDMVQTQEHATPVSYAEDRVAVGMDTTVRKGVFHARQQSGRIAGAAKDKHKYSKEIKQTKEEMQKERAGIPSGEQMKRQAQRQATKERIQLKARRETEQNVSGQVSQGMEVSQKAGASQRKHRMKTTRQAGQKSIKNAGKSVKRTARTKIKTTEQAAKQAHRTAKVSKETAKKAAQMAKQSAKVAKKVAQASARAIKVIIAATKSLITALVSLGWIAVLILVIVILFGGFLCMTGGDNVLSVKLDAPVLCRLDAPELDFACCASADCLHQHLQVI